MSLLLKSKTADLWCRKLFYSMLLFFPNCLLCQHLTPGDLWVDSIMNIIYKDESMDAETKSRLADSAFQITERSGDVCKQIFIRNKQATYLDNMGMPDSALSQLYWVSKSFKPECDSLLLMSLFRNLTNVYLSLGEFTRIDSISRLALDLWNNAWKEKDSRFAILNNLGIAQISRDDTFHATALFHQAYREAESDHNEEYIQKALLNLGTIKGYTGDLDSAYFFFNKAAILAREQKNMDDYLSLIINLANLNGEMGRYDRAVAMLDSAYVLADTLNNLIILSRVQSARAELFALSGDYEKAYHYLSDFIIIREEYLNEERVKAVTEMMEKYESEKKARQIQQLELDKLDATLTNERITNTRNRYLFIGIAVLLMTVGLWGRLRYVHKARVAIQREKDISEGLLLNILPASVADELKTKGYAEAKHFAPVTILFSDFKGFTTISEELSAAELVEELNACFKTFDDIMTKYGIEKIKTIGDSYMAAGNIPDTNTSTPVDVINAGLDMQEFVMSRKKERDNMHLPAFDMRVGIHSGPVVAGIVGVKKFQYDLWGDTVNTASRMETNGEITKVNISEATYQLVRENKSFSFTPRGMVNAKGKGALAMYFVERV